MTNHTTLHINCDAEAEKHKWMLSARIENMAFEEWVRNKLNACTINTNPPWLHGLSERARVCLLGAGFNNRSDVAEAVREGLDISALPNAGRRVKEEVLAWLN